MLKDPNSIDPKLKTPKLNYPGTAAFRLNPFKVKAYKFNQSKAKGIRIAGALVQLSQSQRTKSCLLHATESEFSTTGFVKDQSSTSRIEDPNLTNRPVKDFNLIKS